MTGSRLHHLRTLVISDLVLSCRRMMKNIEIVSIKNIDGSITEHVIIDRGNGEFTSMLKSTWDELEAQREQSGTL